MRLTVHTDYSLRVLMYLAVHPNPMPTIAEIAASFQISRNHLMKVAFELGQAGFIETVRGKHGGLRLARGPAEIGVGQVVRRTEPDLDIVPCFTPMRPACVLSSDCRLRGVLYQAQAAFLETLDRFTLADLVSNRAALQGLLDRTAGLAPPPAADAAGPALGGEPVPRRPDLEIALQPESGRRALGRERPSRR
jgi:Rrf2 family transcriptional regulator, nitric oxide-sensitive transcriptional repressor